MLLKFHNGISARGGYLHVFSRALNLVKKFGVVEGLSRGYSVLSSQVNSQRSDKNYQDWISRVENTAEIEHIDLNSNLKFSFVMPVFNPNILWLREAIDSICAQTYPNWEICIADDKSTDSKVKEFLDTLQSDARIKVVYRTENGHISNSSNTALDLATGEWVVLIDQDDLVSPHALKHLVKCILDNPDVMMIYSDEDKISEKGYRFNPYFKSDWNVDLFYSHNMFSHLGAYKLELIKEVNGFRTGYEGAQDYDLALRCMEKIMPAQIAHIPRVLYHWRVHSLSTASGAAAKPYAMLAGERAINSHLSRIGSDAVAELVDHGYRVTHPIPSPNPYVSIIIPTRNCTEVLRACIRSVLENTKYSKYELIIVDNNSDDPSTIQYMKHVSDAHGVRILSYPHVFNYSAINNFAARQSEGSVLCFLNNDVEVISPMWLNELVSHASRVDVGAVGAKLWFPDNTIQHAGLYLGVGGVANSAHYRFKRGAQDYFSKSNLLQSVSAVTGACLAIEKSKFLEVGGFDESNLPVSFNDVDLCLKLVERGLKNIYNPYAELYHHESFSRGYDIDDSKHKRLMKEQDYMFARWGSLISRDHYYNPNLSAEKADFSFSTSVRY
jgi:O-antigen biosynthesis protein